MNILLILTTFETFHPDNDWLNCEDSNILVIVVTPETFQLLMLLIVVMLLQKLNIPNKSLIPVKFGVSVTPVKTKLLQDWKCLEIKPKLIDPHCKTSLILLLLVGTELNDHPINVPVIVTV